MAPMNPLLVESTLPYNLPDFAAISLEHVEPAFEEAVARHAREITEISMQEAPTWENTVEAFERSGADLDRVAAWFFNLQGTDSTEEFDAVADRIVPKLSAHMDSIYQNDQLFTRLKEVEVPQDEESKRLHDILLRRFTRRGAGLDAAGKTRLLEINQRLSQLSEEFGRNLLADTRSLAVSLPEAELDGLSEEQKSSYRDGEGYTIALELPTTQSLQSELTSPTARRALFGASRARGATSNAPLVAESARLRLERARLLGFDTHADYVIAEETAETASAARQLIADLAPAAAANAAAELKLASELAGCELDGADWPFYQARRREEELELNEAELRNYFPLEQVLVDGVFYAAELLYGITVTKREDLRGYRDDVAVWEVRDAPERGGEGLGLLLTDYAARPSKRGGAWMSSFVDQSRLTGKKAVVVNVMSLASTRLSIDEVTTVFHEFGHALHGLLSDVRYPSLSGTNVPRDWVEFPSQINENYAFAPEIVRNYARHVDTGDVIPEQLLEAVRASRQFGQGFDTSEYLAAAAIDLAWHSIDDSAAIPQGTASDIADFERGVLASYGLDIEGLEPRYRSTWFNHIFAGGYSAGYYSYLWAEALDADGYGLVAEEGINRKTGEKFREAILSRGAASDYAEAYRAFRGRDKDTRPLLARRGLEGTGVRGV
ncbi:M3 family metallopeptidase [Corynebacterium sanguinis]|uniref:M3 family metallopeptidase n=1 Tax=Corynebacterium sanguinis TaxID=2594913 RepID=A0A6I7R7K8_9CORY|nr:M3 family metallopeptidase [Corynebacterium sanguinis]MBA4505503.1 M3 family metallopeptidase [Corynebacterium sanguinis]MCT1411292.1 M3 family metallopeptidase [Corynebacterium sanguinis]MCT1499867.1 M3 family metallopeptidase [Corynebacterium sanguinis]MCT1556048.1 M3 family metallopeptidase [Corynebacterium sanguinis]MCT1583996.1 M3 family metallopeptidase [Corynebacterium sanguinis]